MSASEFEKYHWSQRSAIKHPNEREAIILLANAGWSRGELAMTFETSESTIGRVIDDSKGGYE